MSNNWSKAEYIWITIALLSIVLCSFNSHILETVTALVSVTAVFLIAKGRLSNFYWGIAGSILYGYTAYSAGYYGNMSLNIFYYLPMQCYGWYHWRQSLKHSALPDVEVKQLSFINRLVGTLLLVSLVMLYAYFLQYFTDDPNPVIDAFTSVASVFAMWLLVRKYAEQWLLWILINVGGIYMWSFATLNHKGSIALIMMWVIFLINSLYGAYKWFFVKTKK